MRMPTLATTFLLLLSCLRPASAATGDALDRSMLRLTFSEEFAVAPVLRSAVGSPPQRWKTTWFYGSQGAISSRRAGDDVLVDADWNGMDPFAWSPGKLSITLARAANPSDPRIGGAHFTTGLLTTEGAFSQLYGYFETRLAMPSAPGAWPAFWLYDAAAGSYSGGLDDEIDIVEGQGDFPFKSWHSVHRRYAWVTTVGGDRVPAVFNRTFERIAADTRSSHVYGLLWTTSDLVWYVDNVEVARIANPGLNSPMYLLLSLGSGGWANQPIGPAFVSTQATFAGVHVYSLRAGGAATPSVPRRKDQ